MCYVCCKGFKGWCKSFTRIEACLSVVQVLLLTVLAGSVSFLTLHLLVCSVEIENLNREQPTTTIATPTHTAQGLIISSKLPLISQFPILTGSPITTEGRVSKQVTTFPPDIDCTWIPSKKTKATTHYYWTIKHIVTDKSLALNTMVTTQEYNGDKFERNSGEFDASLVYKNYVAALVKLKPPEQVTFGCILTKVTQQWTLTAASCIESIEEVDSLDSFFIMDSYGESQQGQSHAVADVQMHPLYQGANRSYDLAALRSEDALIPSTQLLLQLPTLLEYFLVAVGERFTILGYGGYRAIDKSPTGRRLRRVSTYTVSLAQCGSIVADADAWALRHLVRGGEVAVGTCGAGAGACAAGAICAGAMRFRSGPCAFCGGTPLLRAGKLFGIMSDNRHCGVTCEPTLYVNVAALLCANKAVLAISLVMAVFVVCTIGAAVIQIIASIEEADKNGTLTLDDYP